MAVDFRNDPAVQLIIQTLEADRKVIAEAKRKSFFIMGVGAVVLIVGVSLGLSYFAAVPGAAIIIYGLVQYSKTTTAFSIYKDAFKKKVVGAALRDIDQSLIIEPLQGMTESEFDDTRLFSTSPDRYHSEDQVSGKADKTRFYFSEVHAEYKSESTDSKGRKTTTWHDIFKGIIFAADFNKNFHGVTIVRPKDIGSTIGSWFAKAVPGLFGGGSQVVELENIEFSKTFITNSTDQIEARYILTPAMMDKLCELNNRCSYTVSLSFIDSHLYIAFPLDENYFEPPLYKSLLDPSCLERDIYIIRFMYDIVKELDLNTRIWGKA